MVWLSHVFNLQSQLNPFAQSICIRPDHIQLGLRDQLRIHEYTYAQHCPLCVTEFEQLFNIMKKLEINKLIMLVNELDCIATINS